MDHYLLSHLHMNQHLFRNRDTLCIVYFFNMQLDIQGMYVCMSNIQLDMGVSK